MKKIILLIFFVLIITISFGAAPPPPPPPPPPCWPPPCIPIDGGISLLMAAGAMYGAKKVYDTRKNRKNKGKQSSEE